MKTQGLWLMACLAGNLMAQTPAASPDKEAVPGEPSAAKTQGAPPTLEQLEQEYAADKITARQFQAYLREYKSLYVKPRPAGSPAITVPALAAPFPEIRPKARAAETAKPQNPVPRTASAPAPPPPSTNLAPATPVASVPAVTNSKLPERPRTNAVLTNLTAALAPAVTNEESDPAIRDVERKIDELLKLKEARDQAARLNALIATNTAAQFKSKRQRLDELIRLHVTGALTDQEYKVKRDAVIAEPEK